MKSFNEFYTEINEALITVGKQAYPRFGHVVIMAGGAGSGKGFVQQNLLGVEGNTFDVDHIKTLAMKAPKMRTKVKDEFGTDIGTLNLKEPEDVFKLHAIIGDALSIDDKKLKALYTSVFSAAQDRKPNLIFDVTLKDMRKLEKITYAVIELGYPKENIHIVWVVNDIEIAKSQNEKRSRMVPVEILVNTHKGVSSTMQDIIGLGRKIKKYLDGDIVFAFNKVGVDASLRTSSKGGKFIEKANYFYVKRSGKPPMSLAQVKAELGGKIASYVPKSVDWSLDI